MVQDQLVEYINSQMKAGVSRDAIKTTLTGAGWTTVDVEDTLKKIESAKTAQPMSATMSSFAKPGEPVVASKPMTIKVSDLVSTPASSSVSASTPSMAGKSPMTGSTTMAAKPAATGYQASASPAEKTHGSRGGLVTDIVLVVVILAVGGFAGFLYMQNGSLNTQLSALNGQSSGVNSQLSTLQAQVAASTTALTAQVSTLTTETQELQAELAFYVAPAGTTPGSTSTVTIGGIVSGGGKTPYVITAEYGAKIYVTDSKVAAVISALAPLMGTPAQVASSTGTGTSTAVVAPTPATAPTTAQFTGIYTPGLDSITLTSVNGTAL